MSNPANRLANFRSYSYYHVLLMCDSSDTADKVGASQKLDIWEHANSSTAAPDPRPASKNLGRYAPKQIDGGGKYVVLINGSSDASYVISSAKWSTATAAAAVPGDRSTSLAVEGSIQVSEPKGIAFLDQIVRCCVALGVDAAQVVYVLKTFFVGHAYSQARGEYVDHITDVPPINFIAYDARGSFSEAGGVYDMDFVAVANGAARMPQYSKAVNSMQLTVGDSLEKTFKILQDNINKNYEAYFNCVYQQIAQLQGVDTAAVLASLRKVNYVIEVGDAYKDSANGAVKYTVTNQVQQYKNTSGCSDNAQMHFPASTSIEDAISKIMQTSPQVQQDMAVGDTSTDKKYEYKVHSAIISKPANGNDPSTMTYTVYYRVERFASPKNISYDPDFAVLQKDDAELMKDPAYARIKQNIIEFDYVYTGKNIDILEFDMKVNLGMAYLQTATLANTFKSQLERGPNKLMQASTSDVNSFGVRGNGALVQTPVFFGKPIKTPNLINTQDASAAIQTAYTLAKHASIEVSEASMKIIGNDQLLRTTNQSTTAGNLIEGTNNKDVSTSPSGDTSTNAAYNNWSFVPAYAKVNIKMPRNNDDFALFTGQQTGTASTEPTSRDYAQPFWFDGYYYVYGIDHVFDQGEFTQELRMIGLPKKSAFDATKKNATQEASLTKGTSDCFDNSIPCGPTQGASVPSTSTPAAAVPHTPPSGNTAPTNQADANTANTNAQAAATLDNVKGWKAASPEVKQAIITAANYYGMPVVALAQVCSQESTFNPTAHAGTSSACGLFQFINGTWNHYVTQGLIPGVSAPSGLVAASGPPAPNDPRYVPANSAYAGAALMRDDSLALGGSTNVGDLYMAHFAGVGVARAVVNDCANDGGSSLLSAIVPTKTYQAMKRANPTLVNDSTTASSFRALMAQLMANRLIDSTKVAGPVRPSTVSQASVSPASRADAGKRTADKSVAAAQNCNAQSAKQDTKPCGPNPSTVAPKAVEPTKSAASTAAAVPPAQAAGAPTR